MTVVIAFLSLYDYNDADTNCLGYKCAIIYILNSVCLVLCILDDWTCRVIIFKQHINVTPREKSILFRGRPGMSKRPNVLTRNLRTHNYTIAGQDIGFYMPCFHN